jgi:hypothetical protein
MAKCARLSKLFSPSLGGRVRGKRSSLRLSRNARGFRFLRPQPHTRHARNSNASQNHKTKRTHKQSRHTLTSAQSLLDRFIQTTAPHYNGISPQTTRNPHASVLHLHAKSACAVLPSRSASSAIVSPQRCGVIPNSCEGSAFSKSRLRAPTTCRVAYVKVLL